MTNDIELEYEMKKANITKRQLATQLKISAQCLYNKINGTSEFKASEITVICDCLNLSKKRREDIFFAN